MKSGGFPDEKIGKKPLHFTIVSCIISVTEELLPRPFYAPERRSSMADHGKGAGRKLIAQNKKAYHDYFVEEKYEAGIALAGPR